LQAAAADCKLQLQLAIVFITIIHSGSRHLSAPYSLKDCNHLTLSTSLQVCWLYGGKAIARQCLQAARILHHQMLNFMQVSSKEI